MSRSTTLSRPLHRRRTPLLRRLATLLSLRQQRARLRDLPPEILRDIGLTPEEARAEADRPFWDAPSHWRG